MRHVRWFLARLAGLVRRRRHERDLDAELRFHLNEEAGEHRAGGLSSQDADRAARRSLGNVTLTREATRQVWMWSWLEHLFQDVRYAVRVLRRRPVLTATALLSLPLGIGANTAVFSLLKAIQLDRLAVQRPVEIVHLAAERSVNSSYPTYEAIRNATRSSPC